MENENNQPIAFMGIEDKKLDMLFIKNIERGKGLGKLLLNYGIKNYDVNELTVNEQNPKAKGFYEYLGFKIYFLCYNLNCKNEIVWNGETIMKKQEAEVLASEKVDLIIEYITQMLDDSTKLSASMEFNSVKINGQKMCTLDIYVPIKNFERHLNLDIPKDHQNIILKEFLNRILTTFLSHETIGPTKFYQLRSSNFLFDGIKIVNTIGSEIKVNMYGIDKQIADEYNKEYEEYRNSILEDNTSKKRI